MPKMNFKVYWDGKVVMDYSKDFKDKLEGYKEIIWIFRTSMDDLEGKDTKINKDDYTRHSN